MATIVRDRHISEKGFSVGEWAQDGHLSLSASSGQSFPSYTEALETWVAEVDSSKSNTCTVALESASSLSLAALSLLNELKGTRGVDLCMPAYVCYLSKLFVLSWVLLRMKSHTCERKATTHLIDVKQWVKKVNKTVVYLDLIARYTLFKGSAKAVRETLPLSHKVQKGPPCIPNSSSYGEFMCSWILTLSQTRSML